MSYDDYEDDLYYDDFYQSRSIEYEYDCIECGAPSSDEVCFECAEGESWDMVEPHLRGEPQFADPGGRSALRAATPDNPRNLPCPNCGSPDRLTPADVARGYQCDSCADQLERGF